MTTKILLGVAG